MKKFMLFLIAILSISDQLKGIVKTFVNNSSKYFFFRVYDSKNNIMGMTLAPGAIQDLFIPTDSINKIVVLDGKHSSKPLSAMTRNELRKENMAINDNTTFIINQNSSIKIYKDTSSRNETLQKIDEAYKKRTNLPTIDLSIHTIKTDQPWTTQNVVYNLKYKTSFMSAIES